MLQTTFNGEIANIVTANIAKFAINPEKSSVWHTINSILVNNASKFQFFDYEMCYLLQAESTWMTCQPEITDHTGDLAVSPVRSVKSTNIRDRQQYGPARRVAEKEFIIVAGTQGTSDSTQKLLHYSVLLANLFYMTSDTTVRVLKDTDINITNLNALNMILLGNPAENLYTGRFLSHLSNLYIRQEMIQLSTCRFSHLRTGLLTLAPNGKEYLVLILMGNSLQGLEDVLKLAFPTIPPMARSPFSNQVPDYVVTGPDTGAKGPGGYLCAGFWGNSWEYKSDSASCTC